MKNAAGERQCRGVGDDMPIRRSSGEMGEACGLTPASIHRYDPFPRGSQGQRDTAVSGGDVEYDSVIDSESVENTAPALSILESSTCERIGSFTFVQRR